MRLILGFLYGMTFVKYRKYWPILAFFYFVIPFQLIAQSISPFTLNNGGGSTQYLEWSITESVSVASFIVPGFSINTGVLQPMTNVVTGINEFGPTVFGSQITMGPIPTNHILHLKTRFTEAGKLSIQIIDAKSIIILSHEAGIIFGRYEKDISLEEYPSGVFYMKVFFKPITGNTKTGIYKIIKL